MHLSLVDLALTWGATTRSRLTHGAGRAAVRQYARRIPLLTVLSACGCYPFIFPGDQRPAVGADTDPDVDTHPCDELIDWNSPGKPPPVINELMQGAGGAQWIEIYHPPNPESLHTEMSGWTIERGRTDGTVGYETRYTFPPDTPLLPGTYMIVAEEGVEDPSRVDILLSPGALGFGPGAGGSAADAVRLSNPGGQGDTVIYGQINLAEHEDDSGRPAGDASLSPRPGDDETLVRLPDGFDTDDSYVDFRVAETPTMGASNCIENDMR